MNPLNDDELNSLLQQAKTQPPKISPELAVRVLRAYQESVVRPTTWRWLLVRPISIPLPLGALAAVLLVLIGAGGGRALRRPSVIVQTDRVEVPVTREHIVYRDCPAGQQESGPQVATLTLKEMQPMGQMRPHVVGSIRDDQ